MRMIHCKLFDDGLSIAAPEFAFDLDRVISASESMVEPGGTPHFITSVRLEGEPNDIVVWISWFDFLQLTEAVAAPVHSSSRSYARLRQANLRLD